MNRLLTETPDDMRRLNCYKLVTVPPIKYRD